MTQALKECKIGIIGCGRISQAYVQAIQNLPGENQESPQVNLTAALDTRPEAVQSTAEAASCRPFTDLETFIRESGVEGAIICAPPNQHQPLACALMENGIHVLCEKPLATQLRGARAMIAQSEKSGRVLMMASKFRHVEDILRAKAMITSGALGDILFYQNCFFAKVNMKGRWNADPEIAGGGVLIDNGCHSVDIVRYILGPICKISAQEGRRMLGLPVEESVYLSFVTENGCNGTVNLSWNLRSSNSDYIRIYGTEGEIRIGWGETQYQYNGHPEWIHLGEGYDKIKAFQSQVTNFVETLRGLAAPVITLEDALTSVKVIEAAYDSMKVQQWIDMETPSSNNLLVFAK